MAEKKNPSRAEQAVSEVKKNSGSTNSKSGSRSSGKKSSQKNSSSGRNRPATKAEKAASGSPRVFCAVSCHLAAVECVFHQQFQRMGRFRQQSGGNQ